MINTQAKTPNPANQTATGTHGEAGPAANLMPRSEISAKWDKFSEAEVAAVRSKDDLIDHVVAKYGVHKEKARSDVETLMNGRGL